MKYLFITFLSLLSFTTYSQTDHNKEIEVIGYAQQEFIPDEIYYEVELADYKDGKAFIQLAAIEKQFWKIIQELSIETSRVELQDTDARNLQLRRNKNEVLSTKTYWIFFSEVQELDAFALKLDDIRINKSGIVKVNYSKLLEAEGALKIEAVKEAKNRAKKMLEAIDEELGPVKHITEVYENNYRSYLLSQYYNMQAYAAKLESGMLSPMTNSEIKFKKFNLQTTVKVIFSIK